MKALKVIIPTLLIVSLIAVSLHSTPAVAQETKGIILIDISHGSYHTDYNWFVGNWTEKGFDVMVWSNPNVTLSTLLNDSVKAVLLPGAKTPYSAADLSTLKSWFEGGDKLLWVAGDSDYGGFFNASSSLNPVLEYLGANLRLSWDAVDDTASNDGASYRVIANETGTDDVAKCLTRNVTRAVFHGPTSVLGWENNAPVDLRNATIDGVSVIMKSSAAAKTIDQDVSLNPTYDYYTYTAKDVTGNYPMLVVQFMKNSMLVVSGEANFADYKNMYAMITEHGDQQQGKVLVDNIMSYALLGEKCTGEETSAPAEEGGFLPGLTFYLVGFSFLLVAAIISKRR